MKHYDVLIIGAGAAGMMCAIEAGRRGRSVLLVDHTKSAGEKIRISGGGRCNFTNLNISREKFLSQNPHFALSALSRYTQWDFIEMVRGAGIAYHEKTLGQLFCDGKATQIIDMLLSHLDNAGVDIALETEMLDIKKNDCFEIQLTQTQVSCSSFVVACGGKSIPKMGATGLGYEIAGFFGLPIIKPRPALVPLTFAKQDLTPIAAMAGTSVFASVTHNKTSFDEGLLFTHRGLSGPSILQISSYWREGDSLAVDLAVDQPILQALQKKRSEYGRIAVHTALAEHLPKALASFIVTNAGLQGNLADQSDKSLHLLDQAVHNWQIKPVGSEGYRTAEVTLGGVDTHALDAKTMQAKSVEGLFFIGEVVDVTGWLGGYNFQWAWSSGWVAGQVV
ncbi:MAG: NAD(P)/FAD-dependent oxidoreductase [Rhodobacterales bacterium]